MLTHERVKRQRADLVVRIALVEGTWEPTPVIRHFIILGAGGDLTSRYLVPALARLLESRHLPEGFHVLGVARRAWDTEKFRRHIGESLERHASVEPTHGATV